MSTGIPYTHTSNPLCERQIRVLKANARIWCKTERTKDWVRLLSVISLMTNSQESSATNYSPHELFMGRPAWFLHAPYPEVSYSTVGKWVKEQQDKGDKAKAMLQSASGTRRTSTGCPPPTKRETGCWCTTVGYPTGHAPPVMTPTLDPTRSCLWTVTASLCGVLVD